MHKVTIYCPEVGYHVCNDRLPDHKPGWFSPNHVRIESVEQF